MSCGIEDELWRVLILPGVRQGQAASLRGFTLPEPRTGRSQGFLLNGASLLEVNRFKQAHSAWLAGERLLADGGMFLATPYDPLFVLLPILDRARDKDDACPAGKFKELDELLYDASSPGLSELLKRARRAPDDSGGAAAGGTAGTAAAAAAVEPGAGAGAGPADGAAALGGVALAVAVAAERADGDERGPGASAREACSSRGPSERRPQQQQQEATAAAAAAVATLARLEEQLACVCDVQKVDDTCYYRLNDQRVLAWLLCKFRRLREALGAQVAGMDEPHAAAYVVAMMAEYVADPWVAALGRHLGVSQQAPAAAGAALQPADGNAQPVPRPTPPPPSGAPPEKKQKVDPRAAAKAAALAKQAVGTKKLTSFFIKK